MKSQRIEQIVKSLQLEIYKSRFSLWAGEVPPQPHQMCTADVAARVLGVNFEQLDELGHFGNSHGRFEVAGLINRDEGQIAISKRFDMDVRRFTAAHEIGHWVLHQDKHVLHRDRPLKGISTSRVPRTLDEQEADYYAACFLVPQKQLLRQFETRFGPLESFRFNDGTAFGLNPRNPSQLLTSSSDSLEWEAAIASAIRYHGEFFESLTEFFKVSTSTMAIRLREIGLGK